MVKNKETDTAAEDVLVLRQPFEGQLNKYTNVVKGWQFRWFVLDPLTGLLEYFMSEAEKKQRPRGSLHLAGAIICPSEEDSSSFTVNSGSGEAYKLRASDARERQRWVHFLRSVAETHTQALAQTNPPLPYREHRTLAVSSSNASNVTGRSASPQPPVPYVPPPRILQTHLTTLDAFASVRDFLGRAEAEQAAMTYAIEQLPSTGSTVTALDEDLLLLKATSQATLKCLEQCLAILQYQQYEAPALESQSHSGYSSRSGSVRIPQAMAILGDSPLSNRSPQNRTTQSQDNNPVLSLGHVNTGGGSSMTWASRGGREGEEPDIEELGGIISEVDGKRSADEYKSQLLALMSKCKLGMEMTRSPLPAFLLEPRSFLEMLADGFSHTELFVSIAQENSPESRFLAVLELYLSWMQASGMPSNGKAYNPILGETFICSWPVLHPDDSTHNVRFLAEQVSHHPPVTAFLVEHANDANLQGSIGFSAKFMGMSITVDVSGSWELFLPEFGERYTMTFPSVYVRSILSEAWLELGGKTLISCTASHYSANVVFHTKPFYGGKAHRVTAEVKGPEAVPVCKVQGDWTMGFEFYYSDGRSKYVDLKALSTGQKHVLPLAKQNENESRKVWQSVTQALRIKDVVTAGEHKSYVEEKQRLLQFERTERGETFQSQFFYKQGDQWCYNGA